MDCSNFTKPKVKNHRGIPLKARPHKTTVINPVFKYTLYCFIFFSGIESASSQRRTLYAENAPGEIIRVESDAIAKKINSVIHIDRRKISSLEKSINEQIKILYTNSLFHPPKGFVTKTSFNAQSDPFAKSVSFPPCILSTDLYYIEQDQKSGGTKKSMDGTMIGLETNNLDHFFGQVGNYWEDCSDLHLPLFFEEPPVSRSTDDYIELDFSQYSAPHITPNKPFRIVLRNKKPLFVPLTRKEFMQFLIAKENNKIQEKQNQIAEFEKNIRESRETLKQPDTYITEETKKVIANNISIIQKHITDGENEIKKTQKTIENYKLLVNSMTAEDAASAVRIDYSKPAFTDPLHAIVVPGRSEGTGLFRINPDYFDQSAGASGAQLIIVYYFLPRSFGDGTLNYLEQKTVDVFNHLDYHGLKMSMQ